MKEGALDTDGERKDHVMSNGWEYWLSLPKKSMKLYAYFPPY